MDPAPIPETFAPDQAFEVSGDKYNERVELVQHKKKNSKAKIIMGIIFILVITSIIVTIVVIVILGGNEIAA